MAGKARCSWGYKPSSTCTRTSPLRPKVFLAAVAEPNAEDLRDFFTLVLAEPFVERQSFLPLATAGSVVVGVPVAARRTNAAAGLLDERRASQR